MEEKIKELFRQYAPFYHVTKKGFADKIEVEGTVPKFDTAYHKPEINRKPHTCFCPKHGLDNCKDNIRMKYDGTVEVFEIDVEVLLTKNIGFDYTFGGVESLEELKTDFDRYYRSLQVFQTISCFDPIPRTQLRHIERKSKEDIAFEQLIASIELFNKGQYIASITLGAAAEELFTVFLKQHSEKIGKRIPSKAELDDALFSFNKEIHGIRNYFSYRNRIKNELKHHGEDNNKDYLIGEFRQVALNHISGAIINYKMRTSELPKLPTILAFCEKEGIS